MIESIWAKNLLCFDGAEHRINCAPLTLLIGPNNSGKSAIITGFNLLRDAAIRGDPAWSTESYNLGDFRSAVYNHDTNKTIEVGARIHDGTDPITFTASFQGEGWTGLRVAPPVRSPLGVLQKAWYFRAARSEITRDRSTQHGGSTPVWGQPLDPYGSNIITYLLERWTDQDRNWWVAQEWLKKIDPQLSNLKSPLKGNVASLESTNQYSDLSVNLAYQGTGIQKALTLIAGVTFSPPGSTIIIEEPEVHLERGAIEGMVDLFNQAVMGGNKQIIISTHSFDLLAQYASDLGIGTSRGKNNVQVDPKKFKLIVFERQADGVTINEEDLKRHFTAIMDRFKPFLKPELQSLSASAQ